MPRMSRPNPWATKVAALIQGGNTPAALAQIKVAPSVRDLQQLRTLLQAQGALARDRILAETCEDQLQALSAPRLHRAP